jgi:hypothetical protein
MFPFTVVAAVIDVRTASLIFALPHLKSSTVLPEWRLCAPLPRPPEATTGEIAGTADSAEAAAAEEDDEDAPPKMEDTEGWTNLLFPCTVLATGTEEGAAGIEEGAG